MKNQSKINKIDEYTKRLNRNRYVKWLIAVVFFSIVFLIIFIGIGPSRLNLKQGDIAQENIVAPRRIVDIRMTNALRQQAENMSAPVYDYIPTAYTQTKDQIKLFFDTLSTIRIENLDTAGVKSYNDITSMNLSIEDYKALLQLPLSDRENLKNILNEILDNVYNTEIKAASIEASKQSAVSLVSGYGLNPTLDNISKNIIYSCIRPNMILNEEATALAKKTARDSVSEVVYETGQVIIKKGDIVTDHHIMLLKDSGLMRAGLFDDLSTTIGLPLLILILMSMYISYLYFFHSDIFMNNKYLVLIALQFILMLIFGKLCGYFSVYLIPVSILTMSLCLIFNSRVAVQTNLFFMLFIAVALQLDIDSFIYLTISGYMGIVYMQRVDSRMDIFKTGMLVSLTNVILIFVISVLRTNLSIRLLNDTFYGIGGGVIAATLTTGILMMWEEIFNIATPFKLLEMSNPNDYVIQKLITEAPGTYHHSLIVSNMAETSAQKIGANSLLARVGAYYHDIGKAEKAVYFRENQTDITNPHDFISPEVSAKIIKNHISDGIYLAEKYRIPDEIKAFIETHHGTSEITFFKAKAKESGYAGEEDFNYHCILPVTKETSIVMLADSVEAAVRSLEKQDTDSIKKMIQMIINKKINEGQLKTSKLSFAELEQIKNTFFEILIGVYHSRIKYPQTDESAES